MKGIPGVFSGVLELELGPGYMDVLNLWKYIKLYTYERHTFCKYISIKS